MNRTQCFKFSLKTEWPDHVESYSVVDLYLYHRFGSSRHIQRGIKVAQGQSFMLFTIPQIATMSRLLLWGGRWFNKKGQKKTTMKKSSTFLLALTVKNPPAVLETWVPSLGQEDSLEKDMATHSSILAWRIHGQRSLVGYSPRRCKESGMTVHACIELYTFSYQNVRVRAYI